MLIDEISAEITRLEEKKREKGKITRGEARRLKDYKRIMEILYKMRDATYTAKDYDDLTALLEKYSFVYEGVPTVGEAIKAREVGELTTFEEDILASVAESGGSAGRKGRWIHGHLLEVEDDYTESMYRQYKSFCLHPRVREILNGPINPGTYNDFRRYMYLLRWLGLIEESRREAVGANYRHLRSIVPSTKKGVKEVVIDRATRIYYRLTEKGRGDPVVRNDRGDEFEVWQNPQFAWQLIKKKIELGRPVEE